MVKNYHLLFLCLYLFLGINLKAQTTKRVYFVGNSVTDAINYAGLDALAESKGNTHIWGRHMIPGAGLQWIWEHPSDGFSESPYGYYPNALDNYTWDILSLQPFDRHLNNGPGDDIPMATNFINRAKSKSPNVQVYIYSRWPRKQSKAPQTADGWNQLWLQSYTGGYDGTNETKDYFEKLTKQLREKHTNIKPILMVPVGQVFHALNNKMKAGQVPGYSNIWQVYSDGIHMTGIGSYITACTYFATLYKQSPVGLGVPSTFGSISPNVASIIQETVWDVVTKEPLSGVTGGGTTPTPTPTLRNPENPANTVAGLNYSYYEGSWDNLPTFSSLTAVETGTVATFSLADRNRDDNFGFSFTGYVNVPTDGSYTFYTSSDDGSKLYIGTTEVVDNDGLHGTRERSGTIGLKAGKHAITVVFFEKTGGQVLTVSYAGPNLSKTTIPAAALFRTGGTTTNQAPTAVLNATPVSGTSPLTVSFNAQGSADPDAGDYILGYEWDFGDGSAFSNSNAPSHTYTAAGSYTVKLRVMDNHNLYSAQVTKTITVAAGGSGTTSTTYEAENATLSGPVKATSWSGYTGTGYVDYPAYIGAYAEFTVNVTAAGSYTLDFRYTNGSGTNRPLSLAVNGTTVNSSLAFNGTSTWGTWATSSATVNLTAGNNSIRVTSTIANGPDIDYLKVTSASSSRHSFEALLPASQTLRMFPNPTVHTVHLDFTAPSAGKATLVIRSLGGREVLRQRQDLQQGQNQLHIPTAHLPAGHYILLIEQGKYRVMQKLSVTK